jgi:hypothetical protein
MQKELLKRNGFGDSLTKSLNSEEVIPSDKLRDQGF